MSMAHMPKNIPAFKKVYKFWIWINGVCTFEYVRSKDCMRIQ